MVARTPSGGVKASARKAAKAKGHTLPGTDKFPINNKTDLANAKHRIGTTNEPHAKVVAYIDRRAKELGAKLAVNLGQSLHIRSPIRGQSFNRVPAGVSGG